MVRRAEPGTIKKKQAQTLRGKSARTGDLLKVTQIPTIWVANSNAKSKACLRVSSIVTSPIVERRADFRRLLALTGVAVEKLDLPEDRPKRSDQKCIGDRRTSFIGHPDATHFRRKFCERVFQQLQAITLVDPGPNR